jgi:ligand-binding sensor domain-containing protein
VFLYLLILIAVTMIKHLWMAPFFLFKRRFTALTAIALFVLLPLASLAQKIRFYNSEQGLPNSYIHRVSQDSRGYIWIATENGASYFDGMRFTTFYNDKDKSGSISSDLVKIVFTDSRGNCWIGTSNGLQLFNSESNTFLDFPLKYESFLDSYYISSIVESPDKEKILVSVSGFGIIVIDAKTQTIDHELTDKFLVVYGEPYLGNLLFDSQGNLWSFAEQGHFFRLDYGQKTLHRNLWGEDLIGAASTMAVSAMAEDPLTGNMLVGTYKNGLYIYDRSTGYVRKANGALTSTAEYPIRALLAERQSGAALDVDIWIGTEGAGLKKFDRRNESIVNPDFPNTPINISQSKIHSLMQDNQGNIWAALFQKGLIVIPKSTYGFDYLLLTNDDDLSGQSQSCATSVVRDLEGNLWVGTDGAGLYKVSPSGSVSRYTSDNTPLPNNAVMALAVDKRGTVWVSTYMGGVMTYAPSVGFRLYSNEPELQKVNTMLYNRGADILYFGTLGAGVQVLDFTKNRLEAFPSARSAGWVYALCTDRYGTLWVGRSNGVRCFDTQTGEEKNTHLVDKMGETRIHSIVEHPDGSMWLGTANGLVHYVHGYDELKTFTKKDGMPNNMVAAIEHDSNGILWVSTSNGLVRFDPQTNMLKRYFSHDGLQDNEFRVGASFKDVDGKVYFGGINGVSTFYPDKVDTQKQKVPNIYFSHLSVLNNSVVYDASLGKLNVLDSHISQAKQITLAKSQNVFSIEFCRFRIHQSTKSGVRLYDEGVR